MKNLKMLTIQILVKNNENTIRKTLESIKDLKANILVADLGCDDKTLNICSEYECEIIEIKEKNDYSKIRNSLSSEGCNFYINPWEHLVQGHEIINGLKNSTNIYVFQNEIISKELRIWKQEKFKNPIYETIINKNADFSPEIIISSKDSPNNNDYKLSMVEKWMKERPVDIEPYYYLSCCYLSNRNYEKFLFYANEYCLRENKTNSSLIMMKYYMAQVKLHTNKVKEAAELALTCLSYYPSLAEFWCLLGDIYYKQKKWEKSKCFYENAMIIGSQRKNDDLPIEINKYKKYPEKIIENINNIKNNSNIFSG
jgi:hypothetical protein